MSSRIITTPAAAPRADHLVHLYDDDDQYYARLVDYLAGALAGGAAAIAIVTDEHRRGLLRRLADRAIDVPAAIAAEQLVFLDAHEAVAQIAPDDRADADRFDEVIATRVDRALAAWPRVAALGEIVDLLAAGGRFEALLQLEALWNGLLRDRPVSLWCAYRLRAFASAARTEAFDQVCAGHGDIRPLPPVAADPRDDRMLLARLQQQAYALEAEVARRRIEEHRKDEFIAMLGHELRNPLATILGAVELVRLRGDGDPGADAGEHAVIERQTRHLSRLVDDLVDVSRVTQGALRLRTSTVDASAIVARAIETTAPLVRLHGHALAIDVEPDLPSVTVDIDRMAQVVSNLISNAAKYTPDGGRIQVSAARAGGQLEIAVADDGIGIEPEVLPHVFELFVQARPSTGRADGGLGVGLTLSRRLAELHGGTVIAESGGTGAGSVFRVRLPIGAAAPHAPREPAALPVARRSARVLVVDDNVDAAQILGETLGRLGHEVEVAHDGPHAIDVARRFGPEIVLLDLGLPEMDGLEVARRMRRDGSTARLIAITGYGRQADRDATRTAGFDSHLVKPVDLSALQHAIAMTDHDRQERSSRDI